jgi:urease accessory protein
MPTTLLNHPERMTAPLSAVADRVSGSLTLDFKRDPLSGDTVLAASAQEPPLRIVRPFRLEDGSALVHLHNLSGGLLGGDCLRMSINLAAGASVQLTSTGATRVYRARENSAASSQINHFSIGENGLLEYVPDAIIPFAKSRFRQQTAIDIEMGGGLFYWEILAPGRSARGEVFEYECVQLKTNVNANGRVIAAENVRLQPQFRGLTALARLGPYRYWTTFYIARVGIGAGAWREAEQKLREVIDCFHRPGEALWGVSTLPAHGLVVRAIAKSGSEILRNLRTIWTEAKQLLYGREAIPPRKVN